MQQGYFDWLNEESLTMLERGYLLEGETVEDAVHRVVSSACKYLNKPEMYDEFYEMIAKGWVALSSPIWSNMGTERGLPIACFGSYVGDSMHRILETFAEVGMMTKVGGGTSAYWGDLRPRGAEIKHNGTSNGPVAFMKMFDTEMKIVSQGSTRRGSFAAYLPIDHPDVHEFLEIRDIGNDIQQISFGVTVKDAWMEEMIGGDTEKRKIWAKVLKSRKEKGYPYIMFEDTANKNTVDVYKDKGLKINQSNLCTEIMLPNNNEESFVCCLTGMNLAKFDEWKDKGAVRLVTFFLDAVISEFIEKAKDVPFLYRAVKFAERHRALGIGTLGWHSYLQQKMVPFDNMLATSHTRIVYKHIKEEAYKASAELSEIYGEPDELKGYGRRNTTLMAVAPNTSSSSILGQVSPGIEPFNSNYFTVGLAKGNFTRKNKELEKLLDEKGQNTDEVWVSIMRNEGSVQHLDFLTQDEKDVFKTFKEINQYELIRQAAIRQEYIDQGQSLNINIPPETLPKDINRLYIEAWKLGVKALYYQRSQSVSTRFMTLDPECLACDG
ncbi:ribonucleoside-diphosphate reductase subunit alpha [Sediminitomix flava]|uniref:Ribonucleoside-diphosphate reductase n=1 Tax=Sediminitomix flava TaxID=379075 RepID=A0A315Z6D0_SEDFL|nr:ribonucleoside-diphosphate reductase subunit alpha [Sediminitomix flava]PWJ39214.1 ribonucleoside-diphosphate reductase alpha chain [Sediminitomix flava]